MSHSPDLLCMGEALVEFTKSGSTPVTYVQGFGGDTSNTAIAAARQGCSVGYVSAVGNDSFGRALMALWQRENIDTSLVLQSDAAPTGLYLVDPDPQAHQFTYYREGSAASRMTPDDIAESNLHGAKILHVSGISLAISTSARDAVLKAVSLARNMGLKTSLDTNLRLKLWPLDEACQYIHAAMRQTDIALPGLDDATLLTGLGDVDEIVDYYLDLGPEIVALKLGAQGCRLAFDGQRYDIPAFPANAVDSTGAGDTFAGAFLAQYLKSGDPHEAAIHGCAAASLAVSGYGAVEPVPDRNATIAFIAKS